MMDETNQMIIKTKDIVEKVKKFDGNVFLDHPSG